MTGISIDVTAWQQSEDRLAYLAYHDPLTGLPNRASLEAPARARARTRRARGSTVAALYVDLDQFKLVNDSLGHAAGDQVLQEVAGRIGSITRDGDPLARLGGDEFMLLCPGLGPEAAGAAAARILEALDPALVVDGEEFRIGASIGIAIGPATASPPLRSSSTPTPRCTRPSAPAATTSRCTRTTRARRAAS
jgi:diguanylate cyclase (GGDEF)-like protein